jgi:hypothetical protein
MVNVKGYKQMETEEKKSYPFMVTTVIPDGKGGVMPCPELMTEDELIRLLRVPEISKAKDYHGVIANLKRMHNLPRLHLCGKTLYPVREVTKWISEKCNSGK